jgi:hypothetical protein
MANPVVIVVDSLTFSNGNSPVRISQIANKIIPKLLPAKLSVTAIVVLLSISGRRDSETSANL